MNSMNHHSISQMINLKLIFTVFFSFFAISVGAQSIEEARALYAAKKYEEAKPIFESLLKKAPNNANYNFWYGVCALQTNEGPKAVKPLELADKRRVPDAPLYLGKAYITNYQFEEAITTLEAYIKIQERRKRNTSEATTLLDQAKINNRMFKGVEQVTVIDSIIVDKADFISAYKISIESGTLTQESNDSTTLQAITYQTERGNKRYLSTKNASAFYQLYTEAKVGNEWNSNLPIKELNTDSVNSSYPFMLNDGITFFYATDATSGLGGLDIFVTRYNTSNDSFLVPENVGMPFNSIYNDYMYVVDEFNNLGWFASDRFQPEGKVCVYVFIPNTAKRTYDFESVPHNELKQLASLENIKLTWKNEQEVNDALNRLEFARSYQPQSEKSQDFLFILNDKMDYTSLKDFQSAEAREMFMKLQVMQKDLIAQESKLQELRSAYESKKNDKLVPSIVDLESRIEIMRMENKAQEKLVRSLELKK